MKKKYFLDYKGAVWLLFFLALGWNTCSYAQITEDFENETPGSTSFSEGGINFTVSGNQFDVETFATYGYNQTSNYLDNYGNPGLNQTYTIAINPSTAQFTVNSLYLFVALSGDDFASGDGTVTFTGKNDGAIVFQFIKSDFPDNPTSTTPGTNNGYTYIDLSAYGDMNIDQLQFTLGGNYKYLSVDHFVFDMAVAESDPPEVDAITVVGAPLTLAETVQFQVEFNEDAFNVTTDDFIIDATGGVTGTISAISGTGDTYTVTISGITGEGTLSLDLKGANDIADALGNSPALAYTAGETHYVGRCYVETFEGYSMGASTFTSNGVEFTTGTSSFSVENFEGAGVEDSGFFLSNFSDTGTGKTYSISSTSVFTVEDLYAYVSADSDGSTPGASGSVTFVGKLSGTTQFTHLVDSGFNTDFDVENGFNYIDFEENGAVNIDEMQIILGGAFQYIAIDNLQHCAEVADEDPPIVQSINLVGNPDASATTISYLVSFNEDAFNVTLDDFELATTGTVSAGLGSISGSGMVYTVTVNSLIGEGSVRLNLKASSDIEDGSGYSGVTPFTGQEHIVSDCFVETFESVDVGTNTFTNNGIDFWAYDPYTAEATFNVEEIENGGAGDSDRFMSNSAGPGTSASYQYGIYAVDSEVTFLMKSIEIYVSSLADGSIPTDEGTLTVSGIKDGVIIYTFTPSITYPTSLEGSDNGFVKIDFATAGPMDYSTIRVDGFFISLDQSVSTPFKYLGVDNFKFCTSQDFTYASGAWSPADPVGNATPQDNILVVDGTATLVSDIEVADITINSGAAFEMGGRLTLNGDINNNGSFSFIDNASYTGTLGPVDPASSINGDITIQQYFGDSPEARRAFRFVSSAVSSTENINMNWQEGASSASENPNPPFGVFITGSVTGENGFDATPTGNPSLFDFDNSNQSWNSVSNTNINKVVGGKAYRLFIRGDRTIELTNNATPPTAATIRTTGALLTGVVDAGTMGTTADDYNFFGNPFQSAVDMKTVLAASTNLKPEIYYIWDPYLNTRGGYVTRDFSATGVDADKYLRPGRAGFVQTLTDGAADLKFAESDKATIPVMTRNRGAGQQIPTQDIKVSLYAQTANGEILTDMAFAKFYQGGANAVLADDGQKLKNLDETLALKNGETLLSIEKRALPMDGEELPLYLTTYRHPAYEMEIEVADFDLPVVFHDLYLGKEVQLTPGINRLAFTVDSNVDASIASDRFLLSFGTASLSVEDLGLGRAVVYPNPVSGNQFSVYIQPASDELHVQMFDLLGRKVMDELRKAPVNNRLMISRPDVQTGSYMLKIQDGDKTSSFKVILN